MSRFLLFFLVVGVLMSVLGLYVHRRASHVFGLERRGRVVLGATIVGGVGLFFLRRVIGDGEVGRELVILGAAFAMAIVLAAGLLFHVDAVRGLWWAGEKALGRGKGPPADAAQKRAEDREEAPPTEAPPAGSQAATRAASSGPAIEHESWVSPSALGRREFNRHASAAALTLGTGGAFYGALFGRRDYTIEEVPIPIAGLPRTLDGLTIVQLSDIHVGSFVGEGELRAAESLVREARPDLIVLTGDLLDHDAAYAPQLGRFVERLRPLARFGVAAIPGNHDHYAGVEAVEEALRRAGAHLMTNAGRLIGDGGGAFGLVGVDDLWAKEGRAPNLERALAMVPRDVPKILLAHQPVFLEQAVGKVQLQLSGHTHGGQVSLGWNPAELVLPNGWVRGRYDVGESILYVNRGFGTAGPPTRLFSPPEVTKLVLVAA
ncbi:MAG: metallophosphoesterase [Sandaracinus sp.]|nr:metallophosphoesterase [Sandaracinus sp.]